MGRYVLRRFLQLIPILIGITFLSFAMMRLAGSDAVTEMYSNKGAVSQEIIDQKRAELGLDKPFLTQYFTWLFSMLRGDMGVSYVSGKDVFQTFMSRLPATLLLAALSILLTVMISIPLGVLSAVKHDKATDYFLRFLSSSEIPCPISLLLYYLCSCLRSGWAGCLSFPAEFPYKAP